MMTALGIALTVAVAVFILSLLAGLKRAFVASGDPLNVLIIRKASQTELQSGVDRESYKTIKFLPGIAKEQLRRAAGVGRRSRGDRDSAATTAPAKPMSPCAACRRWDSSCVPTSTCGRPLVQYRTARNRGQQVDRQTFSQCRALETSFSSEKGSGR